MTRKILGPLLILFCCILWASDTVFRYPLSHHLDSGMIVLLEHALAVAMMLPFMMNKKDEVSAIAKDNFAVISFIGVVGSAFATMAITKSYTTINPSVAILLQKLQPVVSVVTARILLNEKPKKGFYFLGTVAIISSIALSLPSFFTSPIEFLHGLNNHTYVSSLEMQGILLALSSAFAWGICTVLGRKISHQKNISPITTTFLRFAWGFLGMCAYMLFFGKHMTSKEIVYFFATSKGSSFSLFYMSAISGILAMGLYYSGLKKTKASVAAFAELSFPFFAVIINWSVLGQSLSMIQVAAGLSLLLSVMGISNRY